MNCMCCVKNMGAPISWHTQKWCDKINTGTGIQTMKKIILAASVVALIAVAIAVKSLSGSDVKDSMQAMKKNYAAAMSSTDMGEFSRYAALLQAAAHDASQQSYDGSKPNEIIYRAGMLELNQEVTALNQAVAANDLSKAKSILAKVNDSKKKYHTALGE